MTQKLPVDIFVLDAWSILEWLQRREPAMSAVDELLNASLRGELRLLMSRMNYGEVVYICARRFSEEASRPLIADLQTFPIDVMPVDDGLIDAAVAMKITTSASYADCFAAALAKRHHAAIVTGDDDFKMLAAAHGLRLRWVGK